MTLPHHVDGEVGLSSYFGLVHCVSDAGLWLHPPLRRGLLCLSCLHLHVIGSQDRIPMHTIIIVFTLIVICDPASQNHQKVA